MPTLEERIAKSKKRIARLEKQIFKLKSSEPYQQFWHRKRNSTINKVSYLEDELSIERSLLYRLEN